VKRQIDRDLTTLMTSVGRLSEPQLQLLFVLQSMVLSFKPEGIARLADTDVALAAGALASTLEAATKGLIIDEGTASIPAEELRRAMKPVVDEVTKAGGTRAEREVAAQGHLQPSVGRGAMCPVVDTGEPDLALLPVRERVKPETPGDQTIQPGPDRVGQRGLLEQ